MKHTPQAPLFVALLSLLALAACGKPRAMAPHEPSSGLESAALGCDAPPLPTLREIRALSSPLCASRPSLCPGTGYAPPSAEPLSLVCCGPGGCVAVGFDADLCPGGDSLFWCSWGQSTTADDGTPSVECYSDLIPLDPTG